MAKLITLDSAGRHIGQQLGCGAVMSPVQRLTASTVSVNLSTTECDGFVWRPKVFVTATGIRGNWTAAIGA